MSDVTETALATTLETHLGAPVTISRLRRLTGGASRETWAFDAGCAGEELPLILGRDSGKSPLGLTRLQEAGLLEAAQRSGVPIPPIRLVLGATDTLGPGYVMDRLEGETIPRKILRDGEFESARAHLAAQCGDALARIHATETAGLDYLACPDPIAQYTQILDGIGEAHPAFELGLRWLTINEPEPTTTPKLVHGDFRNGNLIVGPDGLRAVLDWELAHLGDPIEDLGWLCIRSWRFGNDELPVGGFGHRDELYEAYAAAGGDTIDPEAVRYWEVFGNLKWGIICLVQCFAHLSGMRRSVELAALGRRACEMELDLLSLINEDDGAEPRGSVPQDRPSAAELVGAVREFLNDDLLETLEGRARFNTRVSANVLGIVERELADQFEPDTGALQDRAALAQDIRSGGHDAELTELAARLLGEIRAKLAIANPAYLD